VEDKKESQVPRYRFCEEGSEDLEVVRGYFGWGREWRPAEERKWSWFFGL
jgi:DNA-binding HxlR family transcriptional regulator